MEKNSAAVLEIFNREMKPVITEINRLMTGVPLKGGDKIFFNCLCLSLVMGSACAVMEKESPHLKGKPLSEIGGALMQMILPMLDTVGQRTH